MTGKQSNCNTSGSIKDCQRREKIPALRYREVRITMITKTVIIQMELHVTDT